MANEIEKFEDTTATVGEKLVCSSSYNSITITCPVTPSDGDFFYVFDVDRDISTNTVTITSNKNISNYIMPGNYAKLSYSSGTDEWSYIPLNIGEL